MADLDYTKIDKITVTTTGEVYNGPAEVLSWIARIQNGNHNNSMLIDRALMQGRYDLAVLESDILIQVLRVGMAVKASLYDEVHHG